MHPFLQPPALHDDHISLIPLEEGDFEVLYALAADPLVWEQHPNPNRYKREEFAKFFAGAMDPEVASYKIVLKESGEVIGSSRFYGYQPDLSYVNIGYTFYGRAFWGKGYNPKAKALMLDYAFQHVKTVEFHVGASNKRSQIAMERLGAVKVGERLVTYVGELNCLNFLYQLQRSASST